MPIMIFTEDTLLNILVNGIRRFYAGDRQLLEDKLGERAVMFRLGAGMLDDFAPADLYAEYNKRHDPEGHVLLKGMPELGKTTTAPDLAVFLNDNHAPSPNLLVVEIKTSYARCTKARIENDKQKLQYFTSDDRSVRYRYRLGCHLFLSKKYFLLVCYHRGHPYLLVKHTFRNGSWTIQQKIVAGPFDYESLSDIKKQF